MTNAKHLPDVRKLGTAEPHGQGREGDGKARARQLPARDILDFPASAFFLWAAFAGRTIGRCCTDRVAGFDSIGAK